MTNPHRPRVQLQLPGCKCVVDGKCLGQLSCTCYAFAMAIDKATLGRKRPTGCHLRDLTNDTIGGTNIPQLARIARDVYNVPVVERVGSNVASMNYLAGQLRRGRGIVLQGNSGALLDTPYRATRGYVNHAVYGNEGKGWYTNGSGILLPTHALVYDPSANGTYGGESPDWWPWALVVEFAAKLRPWGDNDSRILGYGKAYAALFPDTEPHAHLRFGAHNASPLPAGGTIRSPWTGRKVNVRRGPSVEHAVATQLSTGANFTVYQRVTNGQLLAGSRVWYGNHSGTQWVHSSGIRVAWRTD